MRAFEKLLSKIKKPGLRRGVALILTFIAVFLVLTVVFVLLIPQVAETVRTLVP
jgi:predicted PurR-regulated permease PerM